MPQAAMDKLLEHVAAQEQSASEAETSRRDLQTKLEDMGSRCKRTDTLAGHICDMAAIIRHIRGELGLPNKSSCTLDRSQLLMGSCDEDVQRVFSEMLQEGEDCHAGLVNELSARDEVIQA
eukprot:scaffold18677_cov41-Prasinocladus_malaysianus.AAC.1